STIHKAKGLEADKVFWLNSSKCPSPWARQPWQLQQEYNLCYVATTRAKTTLVLIEEKQE
ncbi:MAG TPA: ATP-binding domain-containing protein, partial [Anaerolineales bacterium]